MPKKIVPRWLELVQEFDANNLKPLPEKLDLLSDNGIALVYRAGGMIYKRSIPYLIENEYYCLQILGRSTPYVPSSSRYDKYTIVMENLGTSKRVTNPELFKEHRLELINMLHKCSIRHGDITPPHVFVKNNVPKIIDWAESRYGGDPRPDKRPEGDVYWSQQTWKEILSER